MIKNLKEKILGWAGGISGSLSFLGGYQVCHNVCLGLISFLTILGFTVAGMPLMFLTEYAVLFWMSAVVLLAITLFFKYFWTMNISEKMILMNSGLIIAGVPFQSLEQYIYISWIVGAVLVVFSIGLMIYDN